MKVSRRMRVRKPTTESERSAAIQVQGLNVALENARLGRACGEVFNAFAQVVGRHGMKTERIGNSLGVGCLPAAAERANIRKQEKSVLNPGMCVRIMPGVCLDVGTTSVATTQPVTITESGYEPLTKTPRVLLVN